MLRKLFVIAAALFALAWKWDPQTTTVSAAWVTVCQATDIGAANNVSFKLHNTGANPLTDCRVQFWTGPGVNDWADVTTTWATDLAAGGKTSWEISGNSFERLRVQAQSAAGTTLYCRPYGN